MTTLTRTLAALLTALLWSSVARADLDDIRRAAEAGDNEAQLELGILFQYGFNLKGNEIPALTWYMLSANQGSAKAVKLRDALKAKMTEKDVQEAMEQVAQYKPSGKPVAAPAPVSAPAAEAPVEFSPPPSPEAKPAEVEPLPVPPTVQ
jgi:TPR repeat protein